MGSATDIRDGRYAENEAVYRRVNERIRRYEEGEGHGDPMTFLCECAEGACIEQIHIGLAEYRDVRRHDRRFIVAPGHYAPEMEQVVERRPHHWVVEKAVDPEA